MKKNTEFLEGKQPWVPKRYQLQGVDWLTSHPSAALFWAPGLGKTTTVLRAYQELRKRGHVKRMLIVGSLRVCQGVWRQEQAKWEGFDDFTMGFAHGSTKGVLTDKSVDVVLINYDGLLWATPHLEEAGFDIICFDELTRMKHTNTRRFKLMKPMLHLFKFRWGLTGTPVPNGLMDLFGQIYMLDGGQRLGRFITRYRLQYFHQKLWDKWSWYPNDGAEKSITRSIANLANYVEEKEWNKMPALLDIPIKVDLPAEAKKHYKMLEDQFIVKLQEGVVTASNAAVLSIKLRQCASGSIYDDDRNVHHVHAAKLDALEDLVEELAGDPLLIAVGFLHEVEAIRKHLKRDIPYLGGGVSPGRMDKIMTKWNMGWLPVLLAHPTSVAHGLNLQSGGRAICWFTLTFNSEEYMQLVRRVYRQGQARKVLNYHLLAKDTIDDYVLKAVNEKDRVQRNMLQELKTYYQVK